MTLRPRHAVALGAILALLTGCGSDTSKTENMRIAGGVAKGVFGLLKPGGGAKPAAGIGQEDLAASALRSNAGPLLLATIEARGTTTVLGMIGENGNMRTYATPNQQSLIFRNGILVGTRGLGHDMMSAETGNLRALLVSGGGKTNRVQRYLDGEGVERPLPLSCTVTPGEAKSYSFAGTAWSGRQMIERCQSGGLTIENHYLVTASGQIALSRQWIGPSLGHVTVQTLRP